MKRSSFQRKINYIGTHKLRPAYTRANLSNLPPDVIAHLASMKGCAPTVDALLTVAGWL